MINSKMMLMSINVYCQMPLVGLVCITISPQQDNELVILTGSVWSIMLDMAWRFEAPPTYIQSGRTGEAFHSERDGNNAPIDVRYAVEKPDNAFVTIERDGYWYY
jgi:hypothetical protein